MSDIQIVHNIECELIAYSGSDAQIARAARVSTGRDLAEADPAKDAGLIGYLMRNKHGSPFEHGSMTFRVNAPIFLWREHMRHRIGFSYNEESGRYKELAPKFYVPALARKQEGKPGAYGITEFVGATDVMHTEMEANSSAAYARYRTMLDAGIAREVARMVLPVNIMSSAYVTCNPRSLMNFLELRWSTQAQAEIYDLASRYANLFHTIFPKTAEIFLEPVAMGGAGKVAP